MNAYITTPIFYVNAQPHLGHAYTTIVADAYARFRRLDGADVRFQTGTDEHGDKIAEAAAAQGISPKQYVDTISARFAACWPTLSVAPDNFIRTTDADHIERVQAVLQKLYDQGDIVFSEYSGLYCKGCERFLTEKELEDGLCPDHRTAPERITEQNYFFTMSRYQDWLIDHIKKNPEFITPERYRNEMLSFLSMPLEDLCISRPTSRLTWGIPLPFDTNYVTYVWFDALLNYLTGLGYDCNGASHPMFERYWPAAEHVIAKDILKPHAIFWPTMLKAMGVAPYRRLHVHGYWNIDDTKMSKSLGNVVRPGEMVATYGADTVRYFLLREMSFGLDSSYSDVAVIARRNSDLANDLGNLASRVLAMAGKFTGGVVPPAPGPGNRTNDDTELQAAAAAMLDAFREHMAEFKTNLALQAVWDVIGLANRYIVNNAPWELAKDEKNTARLTTVMYHLLEALRLIALPLQAIMPTTAERLLGGLGIKGPVAFADGRQWGSGLVEGTAVGLDGPLFPRLEKPAAKEKKSDKAAPGKAKKKKAAAKTKLPPGVIEFSDFQRLELRVAEILEAERIPKSDRLLRLRVNAPEERTIVAGIAEFYAPEDLAGRKVIIVANLAPARLMGVESQGMVLAAKDENDGRLVLATVAGEVPAGSRVA